MKLVDAVVDRVVKERGEEAILVVRLHGLLLADDRSALLEIARQLQWSADSMEQLPHVRRIRLPSHLLTRIPFCIIVTVFVFIHFMRCLLSTLFMLFFVSLRHFPTFLSLLSFPSPCLPPPQMSFADAFSAVMQALRGTRASRPVLFLLDDFDAFTQRPKQSLLYNLFDIAAAPRTPVFVIGMTAKLVRPSCENCNTQTEN